MRLLSRLLLYSLIHSFAHSLISPLSAQPYRQLNSAEILLEIKKLNNLASVLYIAAHPDDENTRLLSYLANEVGARTAYLSLTRGDGGQNLIGKEQGDLLGLIRTQELLAARRIDGAEQFFTRAVDFGYSKNPEETFNIWNKDSILSDVVWVIRKFQPDVIITRFPDDGSGGHGHHTASSILAQEAFDAAADPKRFPEQLKYVSTWQAKRVVWNHWGRWRDAKADLSGLLAVDIGQYNPLLGKGYGELAAESRSMHKSQGFGSAEKRGEIIEYFKHLKGEEAKTGLFDGVDMTWGRVKNGDKIEKLLDQAIKTYDPQNPEKVVPILCDARQSLEDILTGYYAYLLGTKLSEPPSVLLQKLNDLNSLILNALAIYPEAISINSSTMVPEIENWERIVIQVANRSGKEVKVTAKPAPVSSISHHFQVTHTLSSNEFFADTVKLGIVEGHSYTTQYWLREPHSKGIYTIKDQNLVGAPEGNGSLGVVFDFEVDGDKFWVYRPIVYKWVDPVKGQQYRNLEIVPPVTVNMEERVYMVPVDLHQETVLQKTHEPVNIWMTVKAQADQVEGWLWMELPDGWQGWPGERIPFRFEKKGEEKEIRISVELPQYPQEDGWLKAKAVIRGETYSWSITRISYPHIQEEVVFSPAEVKLIPLDIKILGKRIGYIPGAGDQIPSSLRNIGYTVDELTDDQVQNSDLSKYDAIVTGVRAYNTNDRMPFHYQKLMKYVENGGNLIVQYNTANFISSITGDIGPYPFKISRDRVTVEEAPVTFADPSHPVLNTPNKITEADFEGWIQERGLYFAKDWDPKYAAPLEMNDPGEKPNKGSLIIAPHGKGHFVYTGISFFRELPAGVPGAYRLFVNLLSL